MATVYLYAKASAIAGKRVYESKAQTLNEVISEISEISSEMAPLLATCSFLVDEIQCPDFERSLFDDTRVDVLPRFAGG